MSDILYFILHIIELMFFLFLRHQTYVCGD